MDFLSNPIFYTALALVLLIFSAQILARNMNKGKKKKYPPVAGTVLHQLLNFNRLFDYMTDLSGKYKTYRMLSPSFKNEIYTADPENVEYILKTNFDNYGKGWHNYNIMKELLGDGIFNLDGDKWRQQRNIASHEFSTKVLRDISSVILQKNAAKLATKMSEIATSNQTIDIQDLFIESILDSLFQISFGAEFDSMCGSAEEGKIFTDAFDNSSELSTWCFVDAFWRIKKFLNVGSEAVLQKNVKVLNDFVFKLIYSRMEKMQKIDNHSVTMNREHLLSRFLRVTGKDPVYLRDVIINFITASKDTTGTTLAWFIYMLCKHPSVQKQIVQELKQVTGMKKITNYSEYASSFSEDVLGKMQYLHAAITETIRLYPAAPINAKICFSDDTLPDGFSVRKGDMVAYLPYAMGRMKFIWGEDAEKFRPERWLNENGVFQPESPFKFTAFQAGPRICLGREFAYRQMKMYSAVLLRFFEFKMSDENKVVTYKTMINVHLDGGLEVRPFYRN